MKRIMICLGLVVAASGTYGKGVDVNTAQTVAYNYYKQKAAIQGLSDLALAYTGTSVVNGASVVDFYVFNLASAPGFVIVSGDDNVMPILGYSAESNFSTTKINSSVQYLLGNYEKQITYVIQNNLSAAINIAENWNSLKSSSPAATRAARTTTASVSPMLTTLWDQEDDGSTILTYNAYCPYDSFATPAGRTLTGCVATAMAQVMKHWNWPDTGVGTNTYTQYPNPDYLPEQTANFAIAYHFDSMPAPHVNTSNAYVARLMYNAGVSVNMSYGTDAEDGSGAYVTIGYSPVTNCAEYALKTYFRYPAEKGYQRRHFNQTEWLDSMINEMSSGRPVIYAGDGNAGGHCWVMDGFDGDSLFHFNWGWSGYYNGYFTVNDLAPNDTFNNDQEAIIRIMGDTAALRADTTVKIVKTGVTTISSPGNSVLIYPNPATSSINVSFEGLLVSEISITDMEGRVMQRTTPANSSKMITLPTGDLPDGMYLLRLQTNDQGVLTRKFIIAK